MANFIDRSLQQIHMQICLAAYSAFNEAQKGTIEIGKLADFVVLSKDLRRIKPTDIKNVKVLYTYVAGKKVYENESKITDDGDGAGIDDL